MNEIGIHLAWTTGQASVLVLTTAVLYAVVAWRRPGAGAGTALAGLAGLIGLSVLSLAPLPGWWTWQTLCVATDNQAPQAVEADGQPVPQQTRQSRTTLDQGAGSDSAYEPDTGWSVESLLAAWQRYHSRLQAGIDGHDQIWTVIAACLFGGMAFGLLRLAIGVWAVGRCRRRSVPIREASLTHLLNDLRRQMNCKRSVEPRESDDLGGPATVGWRRPLLLLPTTWRGWSTEERQAVLAHELAHICRDDYLAWLVARFSVALHFYHPLVHWLAGRLLLQQELAADALGARFAGGRASYLRALANLALRQEKQLPCWPARAFLPARGTLTRRIAMLRTENVPAGRGLRALIPVLLVVMILGISAFRGPAQEPAAAGEGVVKVSAAKVEGPSAPGTNRTPFAYCHFPPGATGFYALRPAACLKDPSMKKYAQLMNKEITDGLTLLGAPGDFPPVEEIDQVSGGVFFQYDEKAPEGQRHRLLFGLSVLRATREFNWKKLIDSITRQRTEIPVEGQTCYKVLLKDFNKAEVLGGVLGLLPIESDSQGERSICFLMPDKRTLIMGSENQFKEMLAPEGRKPAWATTAAWHRAERGLYAVAIDNRDHSLAKTLGKADEEWMRAPGLQVVTEKASTVVLGVDHDGEFKFDAFALCGDPRDAKDVANAALDLHRLVMAAIGTPMGEAQGSVAQLSPWLQKLLANVGVGLESTSDSGNGPTMAHVHAHVKADFTEIFESLEDAKVEASPTESSKP